MGIVAELEFMEQLESELLKEQVGTGKSEMWHPQQRNGIGKRLSNRVLHSVSLEDGV